MTRPKIYDLAALDALPVGSVIMEGPTGKPQPLWTPRGSRERRWVGNIDVMPGVFHRFPDGWYVVAGTGPRLPDFGFGPLTVLHIPRGKPSTPCST